MTEAQGPTHDMPDRTPKGMDPFGHPYASPASHMDEPSADTDLADIRREIAAENARPVSPGIGASIVGEFELNEGVDDDGRPVINTTYIPGVRTSPLRAATDFSDLIGPILPGEIETPLLLAMDHSHRPETRTPARQIFDGFLHSPRGRRLAARITEPREPRGNSQE